MTRAIFPALKRPSAIPGFGLALGFTLTYLSLIVLIPLAALVLRSAALGPAEFWQLVTSPRTLNALRVSFVCSLIAASINVVFGFVMAWVLVRYRFPGRRFVDAVVDLPFALPTAVAGIALTALYSRNGWIGSLIEPNGIRIAYTQAGIVVALTFIGLPFAVRTVQPVLEDIRRDLEEAAATLGASRAQTFLRVILPALVPAILTGFALALARAIGEYGSVIFIAGGRRDTEFAPLLIITRLEEFNYSAATAIGVAMLVISFIILLTINLIQAWSRRRFGSG
ncbi:MAG: sulfate ABC transporter permease subunit CysT [Bauldia sp.]|nr:sulfate ABC transporter permease subunit CysT [Bauldia sp.]